MIIDVNGKFNPECDFNIGTHNGIFHCDEVLGVAILELAHVKDNVHVVRTRNFEELSKLNIVIDIGGGKYDHHMPNFCMCRETGEIYASAGLVWREFAEKAIKMVMSKENLIIDENGIKIVKAEVDREVVLLVDLEDNGKSSASHMFSFIPRFLPSWLENSDYDQAFHRVEKIVRDILETIIKDKIVQVITKKKLQQQFKSIEDGILEIPAQTMPWLEEVISYNQTHNYTIKFVIFKYPAGGWAAQCVPPSIEKKFEQLVSFPKEWAGGNEKTLPEICGIQDATFCHNGCFFVRAKTRQSIIQMCEIAMYKH